MVTVKKNFKIILFNESIEADIWSSCLPSFIYNCEWVKIILKRLNKYSNINEDKKKYNPY